MFPKALGVAERAWNAYPDWSSETDFATDYKRFYSILVKREMPIWEKKGVVFRKSLRK
jgi:hexosaminidase